MVVKLTASQLRYLRVRYGAIKHVDPEGAAYRLLTRWLDEQSQENLRMLAGAGIKWISRLAANRITGGNNESN